MSSLISYKGLSVLNSASGAGGSAINTDFTTLADRIGPCNYTATTDPTSSDNESLNYYVGSRWMNQTTGTEWVCIASSTSTATWVTTTQLPSVHSLTDGATISWNAAAGAVATVTLGGNRTLANPTGLVAGGVYILRVVQDASGSRTLAYGSNFKWPSGIAPVLSTPPAAVDVLTFVSFDGSTLLGVAQKAFS